VFYAPEKQKAKNQKGKQKEIPTPEQVAAALSD